MTEENPLIFVIKCRKCNWEKLAGLVNFKTLKVECGNHDGDSD
jgi:hypothetical protein